jgi:tetratricopeptide (TPR) repeat protein
MIPTASTRQRLLATAVLAAVAAVSASPAAPAAAQGPADPRIGIVELQLQGRLAAALQRAEDLAAEDRERAARWGLHLLIGDLHDRLGNHRAAKEAFVEAMAGGTDLALYSRYRLAVEQAESGHPEVAAGLVASVVSGDGDTPPASLAVRLLRESVEAGGECLLLRSLAPDSHRDSQRRQLELARADCALRNGGADDARPLYRALLEDGLDDETGLTAARRLQALLETTPGAVVTEEERRLLGRAFHQHRDFDLAVDHLAALVGGFDGALAGDRYELAYLLVRSRFWQERYAQAAAGYAALAARAREPRLTARALYQQARSEELAGDWPEAAATFRRAYRTDPRGDSADGALIGAMRIEWRSGREERALELFELLAERRAWAEVAARAALFLAASDLVQSRADRAGEWLEVAARVGRDAEPELAYWRGRLAELDADAEAAVRHYLQVLQHAPYHPLGHDAAKRVRRPELEPAARGLARRRAAAGGLAGRYDAWLLLSGDREERAAVARDLARALLRDAETAPYVALGLVEPADWPLWRATLNTPAEKLAALGLWVGGQEAMERHFPVSEPALAYTRSWLLAQAGALRESVLVAEVLARRAPAQLPPPFLASGLRRQLYPFAFPDLVVREALARGIDPHLLLAIVREESRFHAEALSPASARGLTQFIHPTARRVSAAIGLPPLEPGDLYRPEIALALGAAYLGELTQEMGGVRHAVVASYNAGPHAAALWQSYCYSGETAEYYTKVSYGETRNYLNKVLSSWAQYREIYGAPQVDE